jgi:hypothetical protein
MTFHEIMALHPRPSPVERDALLNCIDECLDCRASCTACADASLAEEDVEELVRVVRLALDCADACDATGRIVARQTTPDLGVMRKIVETCAAACTACADECARHAAHHEHCRLCEEVCRRCNAACERLLAALRRVERSDRGDAPQRP